MTFGQVVLNVVKDRPFRRIFSKQTLEDRLTLVDTEIEQVLLGQTDRSRRFLYRRRRRRSPTSTANLDQTSIKLIELTPCRTLECWGSPLHQHGFTTFTQALDLFAACLGRVKLLPGRRPLCSGLPSRQKPFGPSLACLDTFRVFAFSTFKFVVKLLDRRIALRGSRLLLQSLDSQRELCGRLADRFGQRLVDDGLSRRYRGRGSFRSLGGFLTFDGHGDG